MIRHLTILLMLILTTVVSSCNYVPPYPQYTAIPDGDPLPIDGEWHNDRGLNFKIEKGKMYTLNDSDWGTPAGSVIAREIRRLSPGKYSCKYATYNPSMYIYDYGDGEIRIISRDTIKTIAFPNIKTNAISTTTKLYKTRLADETRFLAELYDQEQNNNMKQMAQAKKTDSSDDRTSSSLDNVNGYVFTSHESGDKSHDGTVARTDGRLDFINGEVVYWVRVSGTYSIRGNSGEVATLKSDMTKSEVESVCKSVEAPIVILEEDKWRIESAIPFTIGFTGDKLTHIGNR